MMQLAVMSVKVMKMIVMMMVEEVQLLLTTLT